MIISLAGSKDVGRMTPLIMEDHLESLHLEQTPESAARYFFDRLAENWDFILAEDKQGSPLGYICGVDELDGTYQSTSVFVIPEFRNRGIASRLKESQMEHARNVGCYELWTTVDRRNRASIRLQEKKGFNLLCTGNAYICWIDLLAKSLAS